MARILTAVAAVIGGERNNRRTRNANESSDAQTRRIRRNHERHFGSFERHFALPEGVDIDKIEAGFKNGVLTVKLPKKAEATKPEKKIESKLGK